MDNSDIAAWAQRASALRGDVEASGPPSLDDYLDVSRLTHEWRLILSRLAESIAQIEKFGEVVAMEERRLDELRQMQAREAESLKLRGVKAELEVASQENDRDLRDVEGTGLFHQREQEAKRQRKNYAQLPKGFAKRRDEAWALEHGPPPQEHR